MEKSKEKIEKNVLVNTPLFQAFLDLINREQEDDAYLREVANKYAPKEPKNFLSIRSIVLDMHFWLERCMNFTLAYHLCFLQGKVSFNKDEFEEVLDRMSGLEYAKKLKILESLKVFCKSSIGIFWSANNLRVAFAHHYPKDSAQYLYFGESIFDRKSVDKLIKDRSKIIKEFTDFIE